MIVLTCAPFAVVTFYHPCKNVFLLDMWNGVYNEELLELAHDEEGLLHKALV